MSLSIIRALQHKHNSMEIPRLRLYTSLTGSAAACLEIGHQIKHSNEIRKSAAYIQSGLDNLGHEFYGMRSAFRHIEQTWSHPTGQRFWTANTTKIVKHAQHIAQDVAKALRDVLRQCDTWDVVAPDHFQYRLQALDIFLQKQQLILNLLGMVIYVASPCELPNYPFYSKRKSLEGLERERISYGCEQLGSAIRLRREMQVKLQEIASLDPEYKDLDVEESWEKISDTEEWASSQYTMDNTTPTEGWTQLLQKDDIEGGPVVYSFSPNSGSHPTRSVKRQHSKHTDDPILEEMLDNFGHEGRLDGTRSEEIVSSRERDLAALVFHWTNAEVFAGLQRKDPISI